MIRTVLPLLALPLAALTLTVGAASARPPGGPGGPGGGPFGLIEYDADNNGQVTRVEFETGQSARFAKLDRNSDGVLTQEEMKAAMSAGREEMRAKMTAALDKNGDGQVSEDERAAAREGRGDRRPRDGGRGGPGPDGLKRADADGDSRISLTEFQSMGLTLFTRVDADNNAVVTISELRAARPQR